jgi:hypothetical protein
MTSHDTRCERSPPLLTDAAQKRPRESLRREMAQWASVVADRAFRPWWAL